MPEQIPSACQKNWYLDVLFDSLETIDHFEDEIIEQLEDKGEASDDLFNDYSNGDEYHHENHADKSYTLIEAAHLLSQLSEYEEGDSGLWEGIDDPEKAIEIKAAYTYGNAVMSDFQSMVSELNDDFREFSPTRTGPKEWSPRGKKGHSSIKGWLKAWIKAQKEKIH